MADPAAAPRPAPRRRRHGQGHEKVRPLRGRLLRIVIAIALGSVIAALAAGCAGPAAAPARPSPASGPSPAGGPTAEAEARHADVAMSAAVAARDLEAFLGHVAPDAIFFGGAGPAPGRAAVGLAWAPFFAAGGPRLEWAPDRAIASASGDLVFTFGHASFTPAKGGAPEPVRYLTAWRRGEDGLLRAALDGEDVPLPPLPPGVAARQLRTLESGDGALLAEGGLLLDGPREVGWYLRLSRREGAGYVIIAEAGALRR